MERVIPHLSRTYPPVRLYLDDLEEIADVIKGSELVEITTDRFRFDTIAELVEKCADQHFSELKINSYVPHLSVRLGPDSNNLACVARTTQDTGGFYRIDALLKRASLKPSIAFSPSGAAWILGAYGLFLFSLLMLNTWSGFVPNRTGIYFTFVGAGVLILWLPMLFYILARHNAVIVVKARKDKPSFLARNRDQLILVLFGAILGAALKSFFDWLTK